MKSWLFVGIDQTGAIQKNGTPKPLPACFIRKHRPHFFYLPALEKEILTQTTQLKAHEEILIGLDCVIGLPETVPGSPREAMHKTLDFPGYGRSVATEFFAQLSPDAKPRRKIEIQLGANSIFQEKPFQKNIQTGTFRCWKELAQSADNFCFPAIENISSLQLSPALKVFEGYPSFSWKTLLKLKTRDVSQLPTALQQYFPKIIWEDQHQDAVEKDANLADAFVLALAISQETERALTIPASKEGWILGSEFI